jgi:hypothetical protein
MAIDGHQGRGNVPHLIHDHYFYDHRHARQSLQAAPPS